MSTRPRWFFVLCGLGCAVGLSTGAAAAPGDAAPPPPNLSTLPPSPSTPKPVAAPRPAVLPEVQAGENPSGEPAVRQTVIEDDNTRIDELNVRGRSQRITVTPKKGGTPYEIITSNGSKDLSEGPNGFNGAVGKRVWPVLSF